MPPSPPPLPTTPQRRGDATHRDRSDCLRLAPALLRGRHLPERLGRQPGGLIPAESLRRGTVHHRQGPRGPARARLEAAPGPGVDDDLGIATARPTDRHAPAAQSVETGGGSAGRGRNAGESPTPRGGVDEGGRDRIEAAVSSSGVGGKGSGGGGLFPGLRKRSRVDDACGVGTPRAVSP